MKKFLLSLLFALLIPFGAVAQEAYAVYENGTLAFYYDNQKSSRSGTKYELNTGENAPGWYTDHRQDITKAVFDPSFANARPKSTYRWFAVNENETSALTSIEGIEYLKTSKVTNMAWMFYRCSGLTSLDLSSFNTSNVTDMVGMFSCCSGLTSLDLSSFVTSSVTNMYCMFEVCSSLTSLDLSSFDTSNVTNMSAMFIGCRSLTSLDLRNFDTGSVTDINGMFRGCSGLTSLDLSSFDTSSVTTMFAMFYDCSGLTSLDLSSFDTSSVTDMRFMFSGCSGLTSLDLSSFNTSSVTNMREMFSGCYSLTSLDLSDFNTSNVTDMRGMFDLCSDLTSLDLSSFDTSSVTDMYKMFRGCSSLTSLDLSSFNTSSVTNMYKMFLGCSSLPTIYCGDNWNTDKVTNSLEMFYNCTNLVGGAGTVYSSNYTDKTYAHVDGGPDNPGYMTQSGCLQAYAVYENGTLTFYYDNHNSSRSGTKYALNTGDNTPGWYTGHRQDITKAVFTPSFVNTRPTSTYKWFAVDSRETSKLSTIEGIEFLNTSEIMNMSYMFSWCSSLTSLDLSSFNTGSVTDMSYMFSGCRGLTSLDLTPLNTSSVTNMSSMFSDCRGLTSLDLTPLNTSSVTNMGSMFIGCSSLTSLDLSSFNTSNVTYMGGMFQSCSSLTSLDLRSFDTSSVTNMSSMFSWCRSLTSLDLSSFDTSSVTSMSGMFEFCSGLTSLDLSSFDTSSVTDMEGMFSGCSGLTSLDLTPLNTSSVTNMGGMFSGCTGLTTLDLTPLNTSSVYIMRSMFSDCSSLTSLDLSSFDTSSVTDMGGMFSNCSGLTSLDLSSFDTSSVMYMSYMFYGCSSLTTIYCGDNWNTDKVTDSSYMFSGCTSLVGGAGTVYNPDYTDKAYAHVDGGLENPGYLTMGIDVTDVSQIDNVIYVDAMEEICGKQTTISLKMKNTVPIRGFQFDLYLPEGATVVKSDKGRIQGALSAGRLPEEDEHNLTFSEQQDGAIRFLCSSQYNETFTGTEGEIATLQIRLADDMADGDYAIVLKDVKLTETDINKFYETEKVVSKLTIISYIMGDISGDGKVDVSDYTGVANYIHNNPPAGFNAKAADVDENGKIDVSDYTGIANIIHTGSVYGYSNTNNAPRRSGEENQPDTDVSTIDNVIYISPFTVTAGTQTTLSIKMKNKAAIRGFQFDLYLPEGMTAVKSSKGRIQGVLSAGRLPDEDEHDLTFSEQTDGAIRFLCSSQYDETFTGTDGELATLQVNVAAGMADGDYALLLKEVKLTETDISKFYETELVKTTVTVGASAGIDVVLDENDTVWYTLDGRKLDKKPTAKGVYINNGCKIVIK